MKNHGFLNTFLSVCSGTTDFPEIAKYPFYRMLLHLLLLSVICGAVNVAFRYHPFNLAYEKTCAKLAAKFGEIQTSSYGMRPALNPDKHGTAYFDGFRVDYFPADNQLKTFKPGEDYLFGVAWTPLSIIAWVNLDNKAAPFLPLLIPTAADSEKINEGMSFMLNRMKGETEKTLTLFDVAQIYSLNPAAIHASVVPFREFRTNILGIPCRIPTIYIIFLALEILINCLLISPVYILIFTLFSFFLGKSNMLPMKFSKIFIVGIYTGFPGIVIATLYTALALPYLDFQSIFLMSYLVYSFPVFARLRISSGPGAAA